MTEKKTQSLSEALGKKQEVVKEEKKVEVTKEETKPTKTVEPVDPAPVWQENPEHAHGHLHPDFDPQKRSSDFVGDRDE